MSAESGYDAQSVLYPALFYAAAAGTLRFRRIAPYGVGKQNRMKVPSRPKKVIEKSMISKTYSPSWQILEA